MWPRAVSGSTEEEHLRGLLTTENSLINALRDYIDALDQKLAVIKSETAAIEELHQLVGERVEEHMGNPLNVLTILKRFQSVWPLLEQQANASQNLAINLPDYQLDLQLPSEEDYEAALLNLLRLQSVYDLKPAALSLGIVHGLKVGSAMSWSDCLEIARKSERNGDHAVAKHWLETAMGMLAAEQNATISVSEQERARIKILEASLNMDYRAGEFLSALTTAKELLLLRPASRSAQKAKAEIERALNGSPVKFVPNRKLKAKSTKSVEQLIVDELCRSTAQQPVTGSRFTECRQDVANLRMLRLEQLSEEPYIMLYHDVLSSKQTERLIGMLDELPQQRRSRREAFEPLQFTKLAQRRLRGIHSQLGIGGVEPELWQARRHSHEHVTPPTDPPSIAEHAARALLSLQEARLGGAIVFPQLELSVCVPRGALLYWSQRSREEHSATPRPDYRSRQLVCPVLLGTQLTAWTQLS
ncbi:prolyl 4-hydroxylase subunit alpha-3 [Drosophila mojavensis]|uniref:prolyl 4-hydroxylase subunit alpha-3 n=1 Tax=Drosophila mojavensis TaxID=7230 RepID=UPI001CD18538|nr:prolyl 4-hydroxylase subunit alpha-3 [Drosophila mojavensis]